MSKDNPEPGDWFVDSEDLNDFCIIASKRSEGDTGYITRPLILVHG